MLFEQEIGMSDINLDDIQRELAAAQKYLEKDSSSTHLRQSLPNSKPILVATDVNTNVSKSVDYQRDAKMHEQAIPQISRCAEQAREPIWRP